MQINVSQLLKESVGATRDYELSGIMDAAGDGNCHLAQGIVSLLRTNRGLLVKGALNTEVGLTCSRCLSPFHHSLNLNIEEEYIPVVDVDSGAPLPLPEDPGSFIIDEHHVIDLTEAIRQYTLLATPMKPLCRGDCAGLCPNCGQNLNQGPCHCPTQVIDPRWSKLTELL